MNVERVRAWFRPEEEERHKRVRAVLEEAGRRYTSPDLDTALEKPEDLLALHVRTPAGDVCIGRHVLGVLRAAGWVPRPSTD